MYYHTKECSLIRSSKCNCGAWDRAEKEIEPTETIPKQDRKTLSRSNGKELPVEKNSHERSSPSETPKGIGKFLWQEEK